MYGKKRDVKIKLLTEMTNRENVKENILRKKKQALVDKLQYKPPPPTPAILKQLKQKVIEEIVGRYKKR